MAKGTVKFFSNDKGYGFIFQDEGSGDVFFHHSVIQMPGRGFKTLLEGEKVEYESIKGPKGLQATVVRRLADMEF